MKKARPFGIAVLLVMAALTGCSSPITSYTVKYDGNGGSGTPPSDPGNYSPGQPVTALGAGTLALTGYNFAGWTTNPTGPGASYAAGFTFPMGTSNVTLYAVWIPYFLSFSSSGASIIVTGYLIAPTGPLTLPAGVTSISGGAFSNTGLTSLTLSSGLSIGRNAFSNCTNLASVTIPASVVIIGDTAFLNCTALATVNEQAPAPPTLGVNVFQGCPALIHVPFAASVAVYQAAAGWITYAASIVFP